MVRKNAREKALGERSYELRQWRHWRRERREALLAGAHGNDVQALIEFMRNMTSAEALVAFVKAGPWLETDEDTRAEIISLVDSAIIAHRQRAGLAPLDDPLPGKPLNAFLLIREHLAG